MTTASPTATRVPLTLGQKLRLAFDCVPLVTFAGLATAYVTVLRPVVGPPQLVLIVLLLIVLVLTGATALTRCRDLLSGVAVVQEDRLDDFGHVSRRRHGSWGRFTSVGRLWMSSGVALPGRQGHRHRITYSPASRIAWRLEPLD